jgi:hypothetical protein
LLALLLAGLLVPALAGAEWSAPVDLSATGQFTYTPQVAVDAEGDAVFTWSRFDGGHTRIQARARSADGTLSAVKTLSDSGQDAFSPQVAVNADGDAVFTWVRFDGTNYRIQARARSAAGTWSGVQDLSDPVQSANSPQVAVDRDGDAVFTWQRFDGANLRIQARKRSATGALSAVQTLSNNRSDADQPQVAVDPGGDAVFTWVRRDGSGFLRVQARARSAAGALSKVQNLSDPGQDAGSPQVAVDRDGDAVFTWVRSEGINHDHWIQASARSAAGTLSPVQDLSDPDRNGFPSQVAVDADGDAVFTWSHWDGANFRVQARARSRNGALSAVQTLSDNGRNAGEPQVAVDWSGDAVFTWQRPDGPGFVRVQARERSAAGALSKVHNLSDSGQHAFFPQVAVDPGGDAVVTWGLFGLVQASAGP